MALLFASVIFLLYLCSAKCNNQHYAKDFEYFGFVFFFYSNEHEPIHVHVTHKGCQSIFELIMDNGVLVEIRVREKAGEEPLSSKDQRQPRNLFGNIARISLQNGLNSSY